MITLLAASLLTAAPPAAEISVAPASETADLRAQYADRLGRFSERLAGDAGVPPDLMATLHFGLTTVRDTAGAREWLERLEAADPQHWAAVGSRVQHLVAAHRGDNTALLQALELRHLALQRIRADIEARERHGDSDRLLTQNAAEHRQRVLTVTSRLRQALGETLISEGDLDGGVRLLRAAAEALWLPDVFRGVATAGRCGMVALLSVLAAELAAVQRASCADHGRRRGSQPP